ncbi:MAG: FeoB-associated Cys-rich membrane protein [Lachnospiraceae bacterium]|nr:FeoB-associated Cys-rich membrane protein [Ruminococcus sp.]MCM1274737.1 FeoB-associated Cys-rich membrane protein [Lachnospiraceae bacterium]
MAEFVRQYLGSIIVGALVLAVVVIIAVVMIKDKRSGKSSCGGDCAHCGGCHTNNNNDPLKHSKTK